MIIIIIIIVIIIRRRITTIIIVNSMEKWKVMLCSGNSELGKVQIKRGIFHGDSLSPLVFVLALIRFDFKTAEGSIWVFRKQREY